MNPRIAAAIAVTSAVFAVLLLWILGPTSTADPIAPSKTPARPTQLAVHPSPRPNPPVAKTAAPVNNDEPKAPPPALAKPIALSVPPMVMRRPPIDPDRTYDVANSGLASALLDRQERIVGCFHAHEDTHGPVHGRPTVRATVMPDDGGSERFEIQVENDGQGLADLDACLQSATSDAIFSDVDLPTTVIFPIPMPRAD